MGDVGDKVVPDGFADRVEGWGGFDESGHVERAAAAAAATAAGAGGEGDDGGVAFGDKLVG